MALAAGAFLLVLFARRPETFLNPQLWAEDGPIFFVQADEFGASALAFPWAGYHNFLLRLIAAVSSPLNARLAPAAYVGMSLLVLLAIVLAAARGGRARRRDHGEPWRDLRPPRPASQKMKAWVLDPASKLLLKEQANEEPPPRRADWPKSR
jgi:hypothetical protein